VPRDRSSSNNKGIPGKIAWFMGIQAGTFGFAKRQEQQKSNAERTAA
jgi:hypothetical protein